MQCSAGGQGGEGGGEKSRSSSLVKKGERPSSHRQKPSGEVPFLSSFVSVISGRSPLCHFLSFFFFAELRWRLTSRDSTNRRLQNKWVVCYLPNGSDNRTWRVTAPSYCFDWWKFRLVWEPVSATNGGEPTDRMNELRFQNKRVYELSRRHWRFTVMCFTSGHCALFSTQPYIWNCSFGFINVLDLLDFFQVLSYVSC